MNKGKLLDILSEEGFRPKDEKDFISFKYEGDTYVVEEDEYDEKFVRIILPNFWEIESAEERQRVLEVGQEITRRIKCSKVFPVEDQVWASIELFLPDESSFGAVLDRCMSSLSGAVMAFVKKMRDVEPDEG